ncbi:hypothetical protein ACFSJU_12030 [Paradesertivirga mongoliensis]|uniref:Lipoprotein n=1 Tax=Paradesertivirga mongoliensis TaxID=2100740 RepID=A0ABW4ZMK9_9SPHI|nr:hypothetical protein [Pedobacter mongoliensis]
MRILSFILLFTIIGCTENSRPVAVNDTTSMTITAPREEAQGKLADSVRELSSVEDIKKEVAYINSRIESGDVDSISKKYNCRGEKAGTITWFSERGQVRMIKHTYSEYSHYTASDYYFVKRGAPFFVYYRSISWVFSSNDKGQQGTTDNVAEKRFYIINGKPVKCLEKDFKIVSTDHDKPQPEEIANRDVACSSVDAQIRKYNTLAKLKNSKKEISCLE